MAGSLAFQTDVDIANRALQHLRKRRIGAFSDSSQQAQELGFIFDKVREAELRNNLWRFATRRTVMWPISTVSAVIKTTTLTLINTNTFTVANTTNVAVGQVVTDVNGYIPPGSTVASFVVNTSVTINATGGITHALASTSNLTFTTSQLWTPPSYAAGTAYVVGQIVVDANGEWWQCTASGTGNTPVANSSYWTHYFGPDSLQAWNANPPSTTVAVQYYTGDLVLGSDQNVYCSLQSSNSGNDPTLTYGYWLLVGGTVSPLEFTFPIGTGPYNDNQTLNCFRLPHGYLRQAPSDPKTNLNPWLGLPMADQSLGWMFEGDYVVADFNGSAMLRFVANIVDVPQMDPMFCEMFAARLATEVGPLLIEDAALLGPILSNTNKHYNDERFKAVAVNGIEIGPTGRPADDWITVRY